MNRDILHIDFNHFYAAVSCLDRPDLEGLPVAACGDPKLRHGIILSGNPLAKKAGVRTAQPIWQALCACPNLQLVPPDYARCHDISQRARQLFYEYTNQVEPFGLDEAWLDVTGSHTLFGCGEDIAHRIRQRVYEAFGLTVSIGVSWNKVMAKLGSDLKKPNAVSVLPPEHLHSVVFPLPLSNLIYAGPATVEKLSARGIQTIGDFARLPESAVEAMLGKNGRHLWHAANGRDNAPVARLEDVAPPVSISNSITPPRDLATKDDVRLLLLYLSDMVSHRLREAGFYAGTVQISLRAQDLKHRSLQTGVPSTFTSADIFQHAFGLFTHHYNWKGPLRSVGLRCTDLTRHKILQPLLLDEPADDKNAVLDQTTDAIRRRYGQKSIVRGTLLSDPTLIQPDDNPRHENPFSS